MTTKKQNKTMLDAIEGKQKEHKAKNNCCICKSHIILGDEPNGWVGGERFYIEHQDKKVEICNTCLNIIRNNEEKSDWIIMKNGIAVIDKIKDLDEHAQNMFLNMFLTQKENA